MEPDAIDARTARTLSELDDLRFSVLKIGSVQESKYSAIYRL
jgi:hypothetical protein